MPALSHAYRFPHKICECEKRQRWTNSNTNRWCFPFLVARGAFFFFSLGCFLCVPRFAADLWRARASSVQLQRRNLNGYGSFRGVSSPCKKNRKEKSSVSIWKGKKYKVVVRSSSIQSEMRVESEKSVRENESQKERERERESPCFHWGQVSKLDKQAQSEDWAHFLFFFSRGKKENNTFAILSVAPAALRKKRKKDLHCANKTSALYDCYSAKWTKSRLRKLSSNCALMIRLDFES